jgi:hypothetical protein
MQLCFSSAVQVVVSDAVIEDNSALYGGGFASGGASELSLERCTVRLNSAVHNGGGASLEHNSSLHVDANNTVITDNNAAEYGGGLIALSSGFDANDMIAVAHNNTARFGAEVAVVVTSLAFLGNLTSHSTIDEFVSRPGAGEGVLPVTLFVSGYYGLPCEGVDATAALHGMYTLGTSSSDKNGIVNMLLRVQQPPGRYNITFKLVDYPSVPEAYLELQIRACIRGEVAPSPDTCQVCLPGSYSLHPSCQQTCQPCPAAGAACPGGAAIVPLPGWWHSSPDSAQMHR